MPARDHDSTESDILVKGVICALIGAVILLAPSVARSDGVRELMLQARLVGWFALVLGLALIARVAVIRWRRRD